MNANKIQETQYIYRYPSPLGEITLASDGDALIGLWFEAGKYQEEILSQTAKEGACQVFEETRQWLDIYFQGKNPDFMPKILLKGSAFRQNVWEVLKEIPYGETITYGEIAAQIAKKRGIAKMSAQAVGNAVGHNPVSILVPCHRVVGANGNLTGYGGGMDKKVRLLELEHVDMKAFFVPKKGTAL